ncbi:MAG: class I SAM-dependent methyltransferase [Egibacteraceae bacterium]
MDAADWDARYAAAEMLWTAEPNRFLVEHTSELAPGRALDLACGEGRNAVWLARRGWRVTAVDFARVGLEKAYRLAEESDVQVDWRLEDVLAYRPARRGFELVIALYLQLEAEPLATVLGRAAEAVAAGGTLLVVGHDVANLGEGIGGPQDARVLVNAEQGVEELEGLVVEQAGQVRRPVQTDAGTRDAIDALVRATRPVV